MKELNLTQTKNVNGGLIPLFVIAGAAYAAYQGGKELGADYIKGVNASN